MSSPQASTPVPTPSATFDSDDQVPQYQHGFRLHFDQHSLPFARRTQPVDKSDGDVSVVVKNSLATTVVCNNDLGSRPLDSNQARHDIMYWNQSPLRCPLDVAGLNQTTLLTLLPLFKLQKPVKVVKAPPVGPCRASDRKNPKWLYQYPDDGTLYSDVELRSGRYALELVEVEGETYFYEELDDAEIGDVVEQYVSDMKDKCEDYDASCRRRAGEATAAVNGGQVQPVNSPVPAKMPPPANSPSTESPTGAPRKTWRACHRISPY